jgi:hypothetical protein
MNKQPIAVLVATTFAESSWRGARVVTTQDVEASEERTVVVQSLPDLLAVVEAWWTAYWGYIELRDLES